MLRALCYREAAIVTKQNKEGDSPYAGYYDFEEKLSKLRQHRVLAINRGEKEGFLKVSLVLDRDLAVAELSSRVITNRKSPAVPLLQATVSDSYDRLLFPSLEREIRGEIFDEACEGAIKVFSENLRNLLMAAPLKGKTVLGYDPGFRTGCKLAVVDRTGKVLKTAVIYPTVPKQQIEESKRIVLSLIKKYGVDVGQIGGIVSFRTSK